MDSEIEVKIRDSVSSLGYDCWDLCIYRSGRVVLTLTGVHVGDCAKVSRALFADKEIGEVLGRGTLEVSSPGINPLLRTAAHFEAWVGRTIRLKVTGVPQPQSGLLLGAGQILSLPLEGGFFHCPISRIKEAWGCDNKEEKKV